jgi:hypothetical protein
MGVGILGPYQHLYSIQIDGFVHPTPHIAAQLSLQAIHCLENMGKYLSQSKPQPAIHLSKQGKSIPPGLRLVHIHMFFPGPIADKAE